jgi:hypothetical protein
MSDLSQAVEINEERVGDYVCVGDIWKNEEESQRGRITARKNIVTEDLLLFMLLWDMQRPY